MKKKFLWVAFTLLCSVFIVLTTTGNKAYADTPLTILYIGNDTQVTLPSTTSEYTYGNNSGQVATGSAIGTGSTWWVSKDASNNYTLTISGAAITTAHSLSGWSGTAKYGIYANGDLKLVVKGNNSINSNSGIGGAALDATAESYGISANGNLTISGDGVLYVNSGKAGASAFSIAILSLQDLTVTESVEIIAKGGDAGAGSTFGLKVDQNLYISQNAKVTALGGERIGSKTSKGIECVNIIINGGTLIARGTGIGTNIIAMNWPTNLSSYTLYQWRTNSSDSYRTNSYEVPPSGTPMPTYFEIKPAVPVTGITMSNATTVQENTDLALSGTVSPSAMADQAITWSITNAGTTGATINGSTFRASTPGSAWVRATIPNGRGAGYVYADYFEIIVTAAPVVTHTITATAGTGGSITPNGTVTVNDDASQSFTITPNSNYSISELRVDGVLQSNASTYTFNHVTANHTIAVTFVPTLVPVTNVTMTNATTIQANTGLSLTGTVAPGNATNQTITWSLVNAGTTGATVNGSTFRALAAGTARVKATITDGLASGSNYEISFDITVTSSNNGGGGGGNSGGSSVKTTGTVQKEQKKEAGAPTADLQNSTEELKKIFTASELAHMEAGENAKVILKVNDISASVSEEEKKQIAEKLEKDAAVMYVDLSLYKQVGNAAEVRVTETSNKIKISLEVPEALRNQTGDAIRTYKVIRIHNGVTEILEGTYDPATHLFTFETDRFSTYALTYQDEKKDTVPATASNKPQVYNDFYHLRLTAKAAETSQKLSFTKVSGADGYLIYGASYGEKNKLKKLGEVSGSVSTFTHKKLKKATYYKYQVKAYRIVNGKKVILANSKVIYSVTKGKTYANPTKVTAKVSSVSMTEGETTSVTCKVVLPKKVKMKKYAAAIRYETTNQDIATVDKAGKITAQSKGVCYVYAYAQNGAYKKIKVTVK